MALPKLNTPTYSLELPSTNKEIKYRSFLVKEQKLLMMAQESNDDKQIYNAMSNIIKSCTFGIVDAETSPLFDIEYVFLKLRAKSVGETVKLRVLCTDDNETYAEISINLEDIGVQISEKHTNEIVITDDIKIVMRYPILKDMKGLLGTKTSSMEQIFSILKTCIWEVHDGEQVHNRVDISDKDIEEFVDSLNTSQFELVSKFFETMPKLRHIVKVKNPKTEVENEIVLEGLESFLE